jgi:hypothetical protein
MAEILNFPVCSLRRSAGGAHIRCAPLTSDSGGTAGSSSIFWESRRWDHADLVAPSGIRFSYGDFGKPALTDPLAEWPTSCF